MAVLNVGHFGHRYFGLGRFDLSIFRGRNVQAEMSVAKMSENRPFYTGLTVHVYKGNKPHTMYPCCRVVMIHYKIYAFTKKLKKFVHIIPFNFSALFHVKLIYPALQQCRSRTDF